MLSFDDLRLVGIIARLKNFDFIRNAGTYRDYFLLARHGAGRGSAVYLREKPVEAIVQGK